MSLKRLDRFRHTFGFRLALWYGLLFLASAATLGGLTYALLSVSLERRDRDIIRATVVRYAATYERAGVEALARAIHADQIAGRYERLFVRALGRRLEVVFLSVPADWRGFDLTRLSTPDVPGTETWSRLSAHSGDGVLEVVSIRLQDGTLFQVGKSTELRDDLLARFRRVLAMSLVAILVIGAAGGAILTRSAQEPLRNLRRAVEEILQTGTVEARVPVRESGDALEDLGALFNRMLNRVAALIDGMRGALDNVAHDLRTPMMRLRGTIEGTLKTPATDPIRQREALYDCLEESDRVITMLDTLMDISEAETGTLRLTIEVVNLTKLIEDAVALYEDIADEKGISVVTRAEPGLAVEGDRTRLRQVVANLLDNAVKYTPTGGRIEIDGRKDGVDALLTVQDTGRGISHTELPRIWERLYRGDKSRGERGLGLGLTLVKAIVEAHNGSVDAMPLPEQGTRFTIRLPRRSTAADG